MVRKRPSPKLYKVYRYRGQNYVKLGGKAWQVFSFHKTKGAARRRLERLKWEFGDRSPSTLFRVVKSNFGWAVVQLSPISQYQTSAGVLKTER